MQDRPFPSVLSSESTEQVLVLDRSPETTASPLPCHRCDPDLFFAESPDDVEFAKSLCSDCPIRSACLDGARARREPWGVWGGELFIGGIVVPRKRPRGRPRKDASKEDVAA